MTKNKHSAHAVRCRRRRSGPHHALSLQLAAERAAHPLQDTHRLHTRGTCAAGDNGDQCAPQPSLGRHIDHRRLDDHNTQLDSANRPATTAATHEPCRPPTARQAQAQTVGAELVGELRQPASASHATRHAAAAASSLSLHDRLRNHARLGRALRSAEAFGHSRRCCCCRQSHRSAAAAAAAARLIVRASGADRNGRHGHSPAAAAAPVLLQKQPSGLVQSAESRASLQPSAHATAAAAATNTTSRGGVTRLVVLADQRLPAIGAAQVDHQSWWPPPQPQPQPQPQPEAPA